MKEVILSTFILQRKAIVRTFKKSEGKNVMWDSTIKSEKNVNSIIKKVNRKKNLKSKHNKYFIFKQDRFIDIYLSIIQMKNIMNLN
jgi:hypothetical protein